MGSLLLCSEIVLYGSYVSGLTIAVAAVECWIDEDR